MRLGKTAKSKTLDGKVILERRMVGLTQLLALDQNRCVGCRDCETVCPSEAISSSEVIVENGSLLKPVRMDIDPDSCLFCGQCAIICPTKAILWQEKQAEVNRLEQEHILIGSACRGILARAQLGGAINEPVLLQELMDVMKCLADHEKRESTMVKRLLDS